MARSIEEQRTDAPELLELECEEFQRLTALVKLAIDRLGGSFSPWLDEALLTGQGLVTMLELASESDGAYIPDHVAVSNVIAGMRSWARGSSWYHTAWPCRIAPLCSSLAERSRDSVTADSQIAQDLGLDEERLEERYTEAGLVFGVSPELLLPVRGGVNGGGLTGAVSKLPLEQRQLLALYFEDGLSFHEIAKLLDISPAMVQALYGRAASQIRACVFDTRQLMRGCS